MGIETLEEYTKALKLGRKEAAECKAAGIAAAPAVLDQLLPSGTGEIVVDLGLVEIPSESIVGTKSAGRIMAFSPSFYPVMEPETEFAMKWMSLCKAHLGETGITDPITCYEYLGKFYVQEGNKRVSVLRYFGAPRIPAHVRRVMPPQSDAPRIRAYYEFVEFYKLTGIYGVQFTKPGQYQKLLTLMGKPGDVKWTEDERRNFRAYYHYFLDAFQSLNLNTLEILPEEALLLWLQVFSFKQLGDMTAPELKKSLSALRTEVLTLNKADNVKMQTKVEENAKGSLLGRILGASDRLRIAFVHQLSPISSAWTLAHDQGREILEEKFGERISVRSYFDANSPEAVEAALRQAVEDGAQVVFATAPLLSPAVFKASVEFPKVQFYNCAVDQPYSRVQSYYARIYEGKFITGAIAGAMAQNDRIGYIAAYPILGEPASINAFALGAQLTNPRAQIELKWTCVPGNPQSEFFADGIRVISNREAPVDSKVFLNFCSYGTYLLDDSGSLVPLASPVWVWGRFYELTVRNLLNGSEMKPRGDGPTNYWLGMDSGVIGVKFSPQLPTGLQTLAGILRRDLSNGSLKPFFRKVVAQGGIVKNDGSTIFTPEELIHMDWLCDNVIGRIPSLDEILPMAQPMVSTMGIHNQDRRG